MADGKGSRWNRYLNRTKHEISFDGETLIERTVRLIRENAPSALITVTSHKPDLKTAGARRYEPKNNVLEIDRFTAELIGDDVCFLYGDVLYSEAAIRRICGDKGGRASHVLRKRKKHMCCFGAFGRGVQALL